MVVLVLSSITTIREGGQKGSWWVTRKAYVGRIDPRLKITPLYNKHIHPGPTRYETIHNMSAQTRHDINTRNTGMRGHETVSCQ